MGYNYRQARVTSNLKKALNKTIKASIKVRNHYLIGTLIEYDQHLNLVLHDTKELIYNWDGDLVEIKDCGKVAIRGDSIVYIDFKPEMPEPPEKKEESKESDEKPAEEQKTSDEQSEAGEKSAEES